jgi:putative hydrolase of HD superfamily
MQPIDVTNDPRRPYVQIAASIRAAILNGELQPGERLPSTAELATFYSVAPGTVGSAIRVLRDEGFVISRAGSSVRVRDEAHHPLTEGKEHPLAGVASYLFEAGQLKRTTRTGWLLLDIPDPETVAEHSFRAALVAAVLAPLEGADAGRATMLGLVHDFHETRIGDVPSVGRAYITSAKPEAVTAHQTADMPDDLAKQIQDLTVEYEAGITPEAKVAHDSDKIELLLQAREYEVRGFDTVPWQDTSIEALRTDAAKQLAQAILAADPRGWWQAFQASYHELRASAQERSRQP